eukprot:22042_1
MRVQKHKNVQAWNESLETAINENENHTRVLNETKNLANAFLVQAALGYFEEAVIETLWVLYTRKIFSEYYPSVNINTVITTLTTLAHIFIIFGVIICSYLSDKYGFGIFLMIANAVFLVSYFFECIYINIILYSAFFIIGATMEDDNEIYCTSYFGKYLPYKLGITYTGYFYSVANISYVFGLLFGGVWVCVWW